MLLVSVGFGYQLGGPWLAGIFLLECSIIKTDYVPEVKRGRDRGVRMGVSNSLVFH
jgi:hypothetical protein